MHLVFSPSRHSCCRITIVPSTADLCANIPHQNMNSNVSHTTCVCIVNGRSGSSSSATRPATSAKHHKAYSGRFIGGKYIGIYSIQDTRCTKSTISKACFCTKQTISATAKSKEPDLHHTFHHPLPVPPWCPARHSARKGRDSCDCRTPAMRMSCVRDCVVCAILRRGIADAVRCMPVLRRVHPLYCVCLRFV